MESYTEQQRLEAINWLKKFFFYFSTFYDYICNPEKVKKSCAEYNIDDETLMKHLGGLFFIIVRVEDCDGPQLMLVSNLLNSYTLHELGFHIICLQYGISKTELINNWYECKEGLERKYNLPCMNITKEKSEEIRSIANQGYWRCEVEVDKVIDDFIEILSMNLNILKISDENLQQLRNELQLTKPDFFLNQ